MKWYYCIFLFAIFACNEEQLTVTEDAVGADILYSKDSYKPYTGKCIVLYNKSDKVKEEFRFKKGLLDGESSAWYKNGQIRRKGYYNKGQISGKWTFWDEQGNKTLEAHYRHDTLNGTYIALYANGNIKEKGQYSANKQSGKWTRYDEDGKVIQSASR